MRPVSYGDVRAAALVLLGLPDVAREGAIRRMLTHASAADAYRKRYGRAHPLWGVGSLMTAAGISRRAEPFLDDPEYCECLSTVFRAIIDWRAENASAIRPRRSRRRLSSGRDQAV